MSYVRWSEESDVYCYAGSDAFHTHVTDGRNFEDDTAMQMAWRLVWLRAEGKEVPQYAIDEAVSDAFGVAEFWG